jgi:hypothetical protein
MADPGFCQIAKAIIDDRSVTQVGLWSEDRSERINGDAGVRTGNRA